MKGILAWFAHNPVAANLLMLVVVAGGASVIGSLRQEVVPTIEVQAATVTVPYPGASPEEVEEGICMRVEEAVQGLAGVDEVRSSAQEGSGTVTVEFLDGEDRQRMLDEVKAEVARIDNFPEEAEKPVVRLVDVNLKVLSIAIWGNAEARTLREIAEGLREDLGALPEISLVQLANVRPYEISVEVSEEALRRYGIGFDQVVAAIRGSSLDLPGGSIRTDGGEILLRSKGQAHRGPEFAALPLIAGSDGSLLRLGDVAEVVDGFAETDQATRFNGAPAVLLDVYRVGNQDALAIARATQRQLEQTRNRLPAGIHLNVTGDQTAILRSRLDLMLRNGTYGLLLVLFSLALFLRLRLAFWVTLGIPVSFLGAIWLMPGLDVSVNLISLFAFILVLGILVDDAIVVAENIHERRNRGEEGLVASIRGVQEVAVPVVFAVLTTIASFFPLLFMPGTMGQYSRNIPLIVIAALTLSLVESLLVLPTHLRHLPSKDTSPRGPWGRLQALMNGLLEGVRDRLYAPSLAFAVRWRYLTLAVGIATVIASLGMVASNRLKFNFFPDIEADNVAVELRMPLGTPLATTEAAVRHFEDAARRLQEELAAQNGKPVIRNVVTSIGGQPYRELQSNMGTTHGKTYSGSHLAEVNLELEPAEDRPMSSTEIGRLWEERSGAVPGAEEVIFTSDLMASEGDIDLEISGKDLDRLRAGADLLEEGLRGIAGVSGVHDDFHPGKRELVLALSPVGRALGLSLSDLGRQVRAAFHGAEAEDIQRGRDEVKVYVRYPRSERERKASLENMRILTPQGGAAPFSLVATATEGRGYATIRRVDRRRSIHVLADVDKKLTTPDEVTALLRERSFPALERRYPGLSLSFAGQQKDQAEFLGQLIRLSALALFAIFALLAIPLRSYIHPLIIMSVIPLGIVGAIWGHILMGMDLSMFSVIGITALTGVVVNDSLVMLDQIRRSRAAGAGADQAVREAGKRRFRAIVLTTLTTFLGLTPLLLERSMQARFLIPMAISLGFGVVFATFITLVLVPALYLAVEDLLSLKNRIFRPAHSTP